jgi:hypothetical protein
MMFGLLELSFQKLFWIKTAKYSIKRLIISQGARNQLHYCPN